MSRHSPAPIRRWQAALILTVFGMAVTAAAAGGWWYARESTPVQGPIVLISVDGLEPEELRAYGAATSAAPAIDAVSTDAVVFERAYAHSPLSLPAHASILAGQLPFEHGVRDDAGFALGEDARSIAELLRSRGFETGAAVSSFLLRPESGVAQGFTFFDAELSAEPGQNSPVVVRDGERTTEAAERWLRARRGHRFFLFLQVDEQSAESSVARLVGQLKELNLYEQATIVITADRAEAGAGISLDDAALHVPLLVKQPKNANAGLRVGVPVQHIDLLPTVLDLVRAPIPGGLRGRSLRAVLDGDANRIPEQPIYAETLAPMFRFGGPGKFTLITPAYRYVREGRDDVVDAAAIAPAPAEAAEAVQLRSELDRLLEGQTVRPPDEIAPAEEDRFAALGYLAAAPLFDVEPEPLAADEEAWLVETHRAAAVLASHKNYQAAIGQLQTIARAYPRMALVQYQLGTLLGRMGRLDEARAAFAAAATVEPDNPYIPIAVATLLLRSESADLALEHSSLAVALAEHHDARSRLAAYELAARVALSLDDFENARTYADAAEKEDPSLPMRRFVEGRILYAEGRYDQALGALEDAAAVTEDGRSVEGLELSLARTLEQLERYIEAEEHYRAELEGFPRNVEAYSRLAMLFHASGRTAETQDILTALTTAVPTPRGYESAARVWVALGEPARAAALRADARLMFRAETSSRVRQDARR
jgi:tetratricopeptide (TPR) repeat protein